MKKIDSPFLGDTPPQFFPLSDGRKLSYRDFGPVDGKPFLYFHGGGSSAIEPAYARSYCYELGLRVIGIDRPGMGGSDQRSDYSIEGVANDALALAKHLQLKRFGSLGMSAGGPFALKIAELAPDRVPLVGLINASPERTLPEWKAVSAPMRFMLAVMLSRPLRKLAFANIATGTEKRVSQAAKKGVLTQQDQLHIIAAIQEGLSNPHGFETLMADIDLVLTRSWPINWSELKAKVFAYSATKDPALPFYLALAKRYANISTQEIPGTHAPVVTGDVWRDLSRQASALL
ncbi:MAG: alpha/beta hydrolase [Pseudomonadota bacterium]